MMAKRPGTAIRFNNLSTMNKDWASKSWILSKIKIERTAVDKICVLRTNDSQKTQTNKQA
jgi:hypothetical protein